MSPKACQAYTSKGFDGLGCSMGGWGLRDQYLRRYLRVKSDSGGDEDDLVLYAFMKVFEYLR